MCKQRKSGSFKNNVNFKLFVYKSYIFNRYKQDVASNSLQGLICHKTQETTPLNLNFEIDFKLKNDCWLVTGRFL